MSHLQGNWRLREKDLGRDFQIGRGILAGSYGGGAGTSLMRGGYVMASMNAFNSLISITALEVLSHYYGGDGIAVSGFKIVPIAVVIQAPGSVAHQIFPTGSATSSRIIFVPVALTINAAATQSTLTVSYATGASVSANFTFIGLVASTP